jgi:hypothetical protein
VVVVLADVAAAGDRLATLQVLRDRLAAEIDDCDSKRDLAALSLRFTDVLEQIDNMPQSQEVSSADEIAQRRAARRGAKPAGKARSAEASG